MQLFILFVFGFEILYPAFEPCLFLFKKYIYIFLNFRFVTILLLLLLYYLLNCTTYFTKKGEDPGGWFTFL